MTGSLPQHNREPESQASCPGAAASFAISRVLIGMNSDPRSVRLPWPSLVVARSDLADLTRQTNELTNQVASARASLLQANKDYVLLENRFRRDVAERVIVERKFNNRTELKAQIEYLLWNPTQEISEDRIREGLNVVVQSNLCYVIAPSDSKLVGQ